MTDQSRLKPLKHEMLAFRVDGILDNSNTDFDLFLEVAGKLALYARSPYKWTKDELDRLIGDGHEVFYYFSADLAKGEAYRELHHKITIDRTSAPPERMLNLTDAAAELTRILYKYPLSETGVTMVKDVASAMVACLQEDRSCVSALGLLANHDHYTYYHSARVAAYSVAIAMHLSQHDQASLQEMATGALLHDVGKSRIDLAVLNKHGALTKEEWEQMKLHPVFGEEVVRPSLLSMMPRAIILHHHERFDGTGYPHNLTEHELLEEVKIAAFADVFDALTTNRPYQVSRSRYEALDFIRHKLLKNVHKDSFQAMVELLGKDLATDQKKK